MVKIPRVKLLSGNEIPKLGFGTYMIGGGKERDPQNDDQGQMQSLRYAIDSGFSFIRTAHNYADGYCEELVGKVIKGYDRKKLFLASCANQKFAVDKDSIIKVAQGSLKALQADYFDIFMIGAINPDTSVKSILDGLLWLQDHGLTKDIGVSNYRLPELQAAYDYLGKKLVYSEMHYNLVVREPELFGALDFCLKHGIILSAYRPLQFGQLSKPGISILDDLSAKYGKSQSQIALRWLVQKEGVIAIAKALKSQHIDENLDIFDWQLTEEDQQKLDSNFPIQMRLSDCSEPRPFKF
jgi:diketogulonate reductase-like aldo/keto reductase